MTDTPLTDKLFRIHELIAERIAYARTMPSGPEKDAHMAETEIWIDKLQVLVDDMETLYGI